MLPRLRPGILLVFSCVMDFWIDITIIPRPRWFPVMLHILRSGILLVFYGLAVEADFYNDVGKVVDLFLKISNVHRGYCLDG